MRSNPLRASASAGVLAAALGLSLGVAGVATAAQPTGEPQQNQASSQSSAPAEAPQATAPMGADVTPGASEPDTSGPMTMAQMQERIEDMQRQLDFMKQVAAEQTTGVNATLPNGKLTLGSTDGRFSANINAVLQFDAGNYFQGGNLPAGITGAARDLNGGTNARRARFGVGGKVFTDFDYNFLYEFGGSGTEQAGAIQELWFQYTGKLKPFHARVGYFEPLVGMEANVSTNSIALLERASPAEIARNIAAGDARAAFQVFGNDDFKKTFDSGKVKVHWLAAAALTGNSVSLVNSAGGFATQPFDEQMAVTARAAVAPYMGDDLTVHAGVHGQHIFNTNDNTGTGGAAAGKYTVQLRDRPELRLDGTRLIDTGALNVNDVTELGAEFGFQFHSLHAQAEYFHFDLDPNGATPTHATPHFNGYYIEGTYILTGEHRVYNPANGAFNGPVVQRPFDPAQNQWGALELAARFSDMDLNYREGVAGLATPAGGVRGGEQKAYSFSLNWYLNPIVRFMLQGQHIDIDRLNAAGAPIGQGFNTIAVRSQLAF